MTNTSLSQERLQKLMADFADLVSDNHYVKTPYEKWRLLKKNPRFGDCGNSG